MRRTNAFQRRLLRHIFQQREQMELTPDYDPAGETDDPTPVDADCDDHRCEWCHGSHNFPQVNDRGEPCPCPCHD